MTLSITCLVSIVFIGYCGYKWLPTERKVVDWASKQWITYQYSHNSDFSLVILLAHHQCDDTGNYSIIEINS